MITGFKYIYVFIVPPATHSNHLVGHAIDFNLETPRGWCNGDCLSGNDRNNLS
jgi:hypothetical protein